MTRVTSLAVGDEPVSGYRLVGFLGSGQFGEVWKAVEAASGRQVALKVIDLTHSPTALKEVRALNVVKNLDHPHLLPIFTARLLASHNREVPLAEADADRNRGQLKQLIIVMGLGETSLATRLKQQNPPGTPPERRRGLPARELLRYMEGAAKGIDYLNRADHGLGAGDGPIVHRDIKPDNLMVVAGECQIADCGVAVVVTADANRTLAAGSPAYGSPELTLSRPGPGTDQYSLAVSYYELRTGRLPFPDRYNPTDMIVAHAEGRLDFSDPGLTDGERDALRRAAAMQPADRFPTCAAFVRELRRAVEGASAGADTARGTKSVPVPPPPPPPVEDSDPDFTITPGVTLPPTPAGRPGLPADPSDPLGKAVPPPVLDTVIREIVRGDPRPPSAVPTLTPAPPPPPPTPAAAPPPAAPAPTPPPARKPVPPPPPPVVALPPPAAAPPPDPTWYREAKQMERAERSPPAAAGRKAAPTAAAGDVKRRAAAGAVGRQATVRYYARMHPQRVFPLLVALSAEQVREAAQRGVRQAVSGGFRAKTDAPVEVEPVLPGCDCYPPRESVTIRDGAEPQTASFWVVPHVLGRVPGARVVVRQDGQVLAEVPLDVKVVKPTAAWACAALALVVPYAAVGLKAAKLDPASQQADGFPVYRWLAEVALLSVSPELMGLTLLAVAGVLYYLLRPRRQEQFWDIAPAA